MSENKKIQTKKENDEGKKRISEKNLALIITAAILVVITIATSVVFIVRAIKNDSGFDYIKSDLSKYIEFTDDYKNFTVNVDIAKPKDIDVDVAILSLLCSKKDTASAREIQNGYNWTIGVGDVVKIWYRGYIIGENGEEIEVDGMCNFGGTAPSSLEIGSGGFIPGFELNLVGKNTGDAKKFEKITMGKPNKDQILYVSFSRITDGDSKTSITKTNLRIDPNDESLEETYGVGFGEQLLLGAIGSKKDFSIKTSDGKEYAYTDFTVNFATECEDKPIVVETYFPYDYSKDILRNETAFFEVYVDGVTDYTAPEFNDELIKELIEDGTLSVTLEKLNEYEGADLNEKYHAYAKELLYSVYEDEYKNLLMDAILEHYRSISKGIKYPEIKVSELYDEYYSNIEDSYISSEGQIYNNYTGGYSTYQSLDTYAVAYLGLSSGSNWKTYIRGIAQDAIKERYIMFYILRTEDLMPTKDELDKKTESVKEEMVEEFVAQYLEYEGKTKDSYTDEEYKAFVDERREEVFAYYDQEYFEESAYFEIFMDAVTTWPEVSTFDDRRAYPVNQ